MQEIDDMWHTFLLFTKDYMAFGEQYFGHFIHHQPNTSDEDIPENDFKQDFERFASYIYDHLGQATLETWFAGLFKDGQSILVIRLV